MPNYGGDLWKRKTQSDQRAKKLPKVLIFARGDDRVRLNAVIRDLAAASSIWVLMQLRFLHRRIMLRRKCPFHRSHNER
jgi:hypothetical protein